MKVCKKHMQYANKGQIVPMNQCEICRDKREDWTEADLNYWQRSQ